MPRRSRQDKPILKPENHRGGGATRLRRICNQCGGHNWPDVGRCYFCQSADLGPAMAPPAATREKTSRGLIVALVVIPVVLMLLLVAGVVASIVIPQKLAPGPGAKEGALRATLREVRNAVYQFQTDTGAYPAKLSDIMLPADAAPTSGLDDEANLVEIDPNAYGGPYLMTPDGAVPTNPTTGGNVEGVEWLYQATPPDVGMVRAAPGTALDGSDYSTC